MAKQQRCPTCQQVYTLGETYCAQDGNPLESLAAEGSERVEEPGPVDPLLGQILDNRYRLDRVLGTGSMGRVYLAEHVDIGRVCAIKVLHRDLMGDQEAMARFQREARAISAIDHPHIVEVYDFGQTPYGLPFLVMEYVEGISLRTYLAQGPSGVPLNQAVPVTMQAAQALQHIHDRGIIHRDIKPENIQLVIDSEQPVFVKLLDFGIARIQSQEAVTQVMHYPPRTVAYAAPEMLHRTDYLSPAIDIYALGITLFEILTKQRPFSGTDMQIQWSHFHSAAPRLGQCRPDLEMPAELESLVAQMLEKVPERRPTAAAVADQLAAITPKLRSVSARSLQYLRTYVLPKNQRDRPVPSLPSAVRPAPKESRSVPQVLAALQSIDEIEADLAQASAQLERECKGLLRRLARLWTGGPPPVLGELQHRCAELESTKSELELDLALLRDELAREKAGRRATRNDLRQRLQTLREELRTAPAAEDHALREAAAELAQLERSYAQPEPATELAGRVDRKEARRHQLTAELGSLRRELADSLLRALRELASRSEPTPSLADPASLGVYVQRLARALSRFDALSASLGKF